MASGESKGSRRYDKENLLWQSTVAIRSDPVGFGDDTVQFAAEQTGKPIDLVVYPGADGAFDFYDDAGDGYGYERGEYCLLPMRWDDAGRILTLGEQRGTFPVSYTFNVRAANGGETKTVIYTGKVVSIAL